MAENIYIRCDKTYPDNINILTNLATLYLLSPKSFANKYGSEQAVLDKSIKLFTRLANLDPSNQSIYQLLIMAGDKQKE